ncbi:hypothetical protein [Aeromicrobium sp. Root236]|nr:hypothetical protein [Aeromicrobium sp. Root236]
MLTAARRRPFRSAFVAVVAGLGVFAAAYTATGHSLQHLVGYPCT